MVWFAGWSAALSILLGLFFALVKGGRWKVESGGRFQFMLAPGCGLLGKAHQRL